MKRHANRIGEEFSQTVQFIKSETTLKQKKTKIDVQNVYGLDRNTKNLEKRDIQFLENDKLDLNSHENEGEKTKTETVPTRKQFPKVGEFNSAIHGLSSESVLRTCFRVGEVLAVFRMKRRDVCIIVEFFGKVYYVCSQYMLVLLHKNEI